MRKFKKNILMSFLFVSLCLTITTFALAYTEAEPPGPPGVPYITNTTASSCDLKYAAPTNDGGAPIVSYDIECREEWSFRWKNKGTTTRLTHTVNSLIEGSEVMFRVIASNKVGKSEPSRTSQFILITGAH